MSRDRFRTEREIKEYAKKSANLLDGFVVEEEHSVVLCEKRREWQYSTRKLKEEFKHANGHY